MSRVRLAVLCLSLIALLFAAAGGPGAPAAAGGNGPALAPYVPGEILVGFKPGARALDRASARAQLNANRIGTFMSGSEHWRLGPGMTVEAAIARLQHNPNIRFAEPNYILSTDVVPNDPRFGELYAMVNTGQTGGTADADIDADQAWGISRGSRSVLVGVIDTGVDYNHPDLAANIWTNPGEIPGNGVDDDNNGFIDDVHGYDFINNDGDPFDDNGHGTHVSGTIGAVGNNGIGVVGVNWEVSIMALKFLSAGGSGSTANAVRAVDYATMMGVSLTSNSWGGGGFSQELYDAIARANAAEIPFIAAAGNSGVNTDVTPNYPSTYDLPNIIAVAATDHNDQVASFSNWGAVTVDIAAPGVDILSTQPGNLYQLLSGTSMATPHVAGVAALLKSRFPGIPAAQLKFALMHSADQKPQLNPVTGSRPVASGGRLNAFLAIADPDQVPPGTIGDLATNNAGSNTMGLSWTATGDDGGTGTATFYQVRYSTSPIDENNFSSATRAGNEPTPAAAGSAQSMEVHGLAAGTGYYFAIKAYDEWGNAGPISNLATGTTLPPPTLGYTPSSISDTLFTGQTSDHMIEVRNDGVGTLDFTIPQPLLGAPMSAPFEPLILGKDDPDPRSGDPVIAGAGGPDAFGYRWVDSDQPGGPGFAWTDISGTGTLISDVTTDDDTGAAIPLGFNFPFYGTFFNSIRVCSNGWLSFTSSSTAYLNQPLPNSGGPENLIAPFWDDMNPNGVALIYYQTFGNRAIVQWNQMPRYQASATNSQEPGSSLTFQAILDSSGGITFQYLSLAGTLNSATVGIQNASNTIGLQTAFNQVYLHDNLAVRIAAIPQWLTVTPASGRIAAGGSMMLTAHMDAGGLEGGTYPGVIRIQNNDPTQPNAAVAASLHVVGAPDASVQPSSLAYGDQFVGLPHDFALTVANVGTDTLHVTGITAGDPSVAPLPSSFDIPPHGSQNVTVRWTPSALGPLSTSLDIASNDAGEPHIMVPVSGNAIPAPVVVVDPTSLTQTLFSGNTSTRTLTVSNAGGSNLILTASADQGNDIFSEGEGTLAVGGPDAFGYRFKDSDAPGGPTFQWVDISTTGTAISFTSLDDSVSATIPMGMSFPFYGNSFTQLRVSTNGWLTFDTTASSSAASNGTLPSTSLPVNSIAMFWDDLHLRVAGRVRYLNDGTRFIVQFTDVDRFSTTELPSPAHLTFQVQLYPDGRILLQYLTMSGRLNSATVGVQNGNRTIALQVVSQTGTGTPYVHNNLANIIRRVPKWLTVSPAGATVAPGASQDFTVGFDATARPGGALVGNIRLGTNIPTQSQVLVPATLNVIGAPAAVVTPTSFNYGTVFAGYPQLTTFLVSNNGTADLNVSDITTTDPSLTVESAPGPTVAFPLQPGGARLFDLRWSPTGAGGLSASVNVHSDDPARPTVSIAVTGNAILPPLAVSDPNSFTMSMNVGDVQTEQLHLENQGSTNLTFSTAIHALGGTPVTQYPELELKKEEPDPRPGILGSGGPDLFGYRWKDSDEPGGPAFGWVDISGVGTPITTLNGDDQNSGPIPMGFSFPFYGNSFSSVSVCTNGWLSFTSSLTSFTNQPLPNTGSGVPENLVAAFWDDLVFRTASGSTPRTSKAYYYNDGTRFIVQYQHVYRIGNTTTDDLNFEVILYPSGRIEYQYLSMATSTLDSATIGIQNATRNDGLTTSFNAVYVHNSLAVQFRPPFDFLSVSPSSGTLPPGGMIDLNVRVDATNLIGGDYAAEVDLLTNDPAHGLINTPLHLHVTGIPDIDVQPTSLLFPTTYLGFSSSRTVSVRNVGTDVLHLTSHALSGDFSTPGLTTPASVPVGGSMQVGVLFTPTLPGTRMGSLTIASDDPDEGSVSVSLQGDALIPPEVGAAPAAINTALPPAGARTKTLTISNSGGSDLVWSVGTNIISIVQPGTYLDLAKDEDDPRIGILGSGGPDTFGYTWRDSDEPGGPTFSWTDISSTGTPITSLAGGTTGGDDEIATVPIGFPFSFYGSTFSTVNVSTNGWLSFTSTLTRPGFTNQPLPNSGSGVPENLLAGFWDDLDFVDQVKAHYLNDGTRFIVQYTGVDRFSTSPAGRFTFQVILYPSGRIVYQYLTMTGQVADATIGIQNAAKNDGLTVVFNAAYAHDNLAIEIKPFPSWIHVSPTGGTIPVNGHQDVTVTLNALGLNDGMHESTIDVSSNDPYTPMLQVPVSLNVGLVTPTMVDFDPDVLNLSSNGQCVKVTIELPAGLDPHNIDLSSLRLNDSVGTPPNPCSPPSFDDADHDGVEEISVKFDRTQVEALLAQQPTGMAELTVQGEVADVQWFRGSTMVRTMRPRDVEPMGGEYLLEGQPITITWLPPAYGSGNIKYHVQVTRDGGTTWEALASNLTATSYDWTVTGPATAQARVRIVAVDNQGVLGYGTSAGDFTIAGSQLGPPNAVGDTLDLSVDAGDLVMKWARPASDPAHGPVGHYLVLRSDSAQGPFTQVGDTTVEEFRDPLAGTAGATIYYYKVIAANAAGEAAE